jgi:hypothetical protein
MKRMKRWMSGLALAVVASGGAAAAKGQCVGDCNGNGQVTVNELIQMVNIALGNADISVCNAGDANGEGVITVNEIITAVNSALSGCVGQACDPNNPGACASGFCTNNVCCDEASCINPVDRCDITGSAGVCSPPLQKGDACVKDTDCEDPLLCACDPLSHQLACSYPSPTAAPILISVGSARGVPGGAASVTVSLATCRESVVATRNDIIFDATALSVSGCAVNASIGKTLTSSLVAAGTVRVFVQAGQNLSPIPDGPVYSCTFQVAQFAVPTSYPLGVQNPIAFDAAGTRLPFVGGKNGSINVSLVP